MAETIKAWTAGIIDGEGWIGWRKNGHGTKKNPTVQVENTDKRICDSLYEQWGGWIYSYGTRKYRPKSNPTWLWRISGQKCRTFLKDIEKYLVSKREKAEEILKD